MQIVVKGKNMEVNERLKQFVDGKVAKLSRVLPSIAEAEIEFTSEKAKSSDSRFIAQVTLKTNGQLIRAEQSAGDTYSALDRVLDKLDRQITRYKTKRTFNKAGGESKGVPKGLPEAELAVEEPDEEEYVGRLVRTKRFTMKPMDVEEALEQMELLGHSFFVFFNSKTHAVSVVYKRNDGDFGLIEPEKV
ncbi:MAG TPA: ribosome-associated translation inhibitor RaiA [Chloroflexota bacterium]